MSDRYGQRNIVKMWNQWNTLRRLIRAEGSPAIQEAWDQVESWVDFVFGKRGAE